jgi:hypothetical protein
MRTIGYVSTRPQLFYGRSTKSIREAISKLTEKARCDEVRSVDNELRVTVLCWN